MNSINFWILFAIQDDAVTVPNVTSQTQVHVSKKRRRIPKTQKDQYNMAMDLFKKMSDNLSSLSESDFQDKLQLFFDINALIKENKPVRLLQHNNDTTTLVADEVAADAADEVAADAVDEFEENSEKTPVEKTEKEVRQIYGETNYSFLK